MRAASRWVRALAALLVTLAATSQTSAQTPSGNIELEKLPIRRGDEAVAAPAPPPSSSRLATSRPTTKQSVAGAARADKSAGFDPARVAGALAIVVVLIFLLRWAAKRFFTAAGATRSTRVVQVLSRSPLSPKQQLVVLRVGRRLLVVADGGGQMTTLSEITDPDEVAALIGQVHDEHAERTGASFGSVFRKLRGHYEDKPDARIDRPEADVEEQPQQQQPATDNGNEDAVVSSTRRELDGLMDKVRMLARQFK